MSNGEMEAPSTVQVTLLGREYQVSCPPSEQEALLRSARHLDENMRRIKSRGNIHGLDKIAVMAALNITHEMLQKNHSLNAHQQETARQVRHIEEKIDRALHEARQIEL